MLNLLTNIKNRTLGLIDLVFSKSMNLLEVVLNEVSVMVEWIFKVGVRVCVLYLLYDLAFKDLLDKILEVF
tara:strand:+ start:960 stop:1172 length:213 start_codon:yes stop_codon:yes gene_type:complete